jgi:hypothetical protein
LSGALSIEQLLDAIGQPCRELVHHVPLLSFGALGVLVFGRLGGRPERIKEALDGPTRDEHSPAHAATGELPLSNPVLDRLCAHADESGRFARGHIPAKRGARIWRDECLLHQPLDSASSTLVALSAQANDQLTNDLRIRPAQRHANTKVS